MGLNSKFYQVMQTCRKILWNNDIEKKLSNSMTKKSELILNYSSPRFYDNLNSFIHRFH